MHDLVGINVITRVLLVYTCQQGVYPRGHVLPLRLPLFEVRTELLTSFLVVLRLLSSVVMSEVLILVAARSKACELLVSRIVVSIPAAGMDVCLLCLYVVLSCVGRGLCDGMITRPEESCGAYNCV
jgi:hypothetical protein